MPQLIQETRAAGHNAALVTNDTLPPLFDFWMDPAQIALRFGRAIVQVRFRNLDRLTRKKGRQAEHSLQGFEQGHLPVHRASRQPQSWHHPPGMPSPYLKQASN